MTKRAALYARVSTDNQTVENQLAQLRIVAKQRGWEIVGEYTDRGISGAKGRDQRPQFDALCKDATRGRFDVVMAWSVDRLSRSLQHLVGFLNELRALHIDLYLHQEGIDTSTPAGRAMYQMCGVFSELERAIIQERVKAGLARAKSQGKRLGRPMVSPRTEATIRQFRAEGMGIHKIARNARCGVSTVQRVLSGS